MPEMSLGNGYTIDLADGWTFVHALQDAAKRCGRHGRCQHREAQTWLRRENDGTVGTFSSEHDRSAVNAHQCWYWAKFGATQWANDPKHDWHLAAVSGIAETENTISGKLPKSLSNPDQDSNRYPQGARCGLRFSQPF